MTPDSSKQKLGERPFGRAFLEWLPGIVGGFLPLGAFLLALGVGEGTRTQTPGEDHLRAGLVSHGLVLVIVISSVGLISWISRLKLGSMPEFLAEGRGPIGLVVSLLTSAIYGTVLYTIQELNGVRGWMPEMTILGVIWAASASYFMEVAVARVHIMVESHQRGQARVASRWDGSIDAPARF